MTMNEFLKELEQYSKYFSPAAMDFYTELKEKILSDSYFAYL